MSCILRLDVEKNPQTAYCTLRQTDKMKPNPPEPLLVNQLAWFQVFTVFLYTFTES